jgi:hypothetical protein
MVKKIFEMPRKPSEHAQKVPIKMFRPSKNTHVVTLSL